MQSPASVTAWSSAVSYATMSCGDITLTVRLWKRPQVKQGGRYRVGFGEIEIDAIELLPFAAITAEDVDRAGQADRETLRRRAHTPDRSKRTRWSIGSSSVQSSNNEPRYGDRRRRKSTAADS